MDNILFTLFILVSSPRLVSILGKSELCTLNNMDSVYYESVVDERIWAQNGKIKSFSDQNSLHISSMSQNILKSDLKKPKICLIWG